MTVAESKFMELVPTHLRNISKQLETLNETIAGLTGTPNNNDESSCKDYLIKETIVLLAADLYQIIYDKMENWSDTAETIIDLAEEFEKKLQWRKDDTEDRDFIEELEKFEKKVKKEYK